MDLSALTPEQKKALKEQLQAEERAEEARKQNERKAYKDLVDITVENSAKKLIALSCEMQRIKQEIFQECATLIKSKNELFKTKGDRKSDTFTTSDNKYRLSLGNRTNEGWDDTVDAGLEKIEDFLSTLISDDKSKALVSTIRRLMAKDAKGSLKANKVLELKQLAQEVDDELLNEGIAIIEAAYKPVVSCQYIQLEVRDDEDEHGKMKTIPLSLSAM